MAFAKRRPFAVEASLIVTSARKAGPSNILNAAGMLRLRKDNRFAIILAPLSMTIPSHFAREINSATGGFTPYTAEKLF